MHKEVISLAICAVSAAVGAVIVRTLGHAALVCFTLYPLWLFLAEWSGGRLAFTRHRVTDFRRLAEIRSLTISPIARSIWWGSIAIGLAGLVTVIR